MLTFAKEGPQINKFEVVEGVRSYGIVGKQLYSSSNIMEIANQLLGVTMHEAGVSRLVSVDVDEAVEMAETA